MLTLIDRYIIKKYLSTFTVLFIMFIPIAIMVDVSDKVDKFLERKVPFDAIVGYYLDFTVYFANLLFPIFLFISVIWFTSKMANNTEVVAMLSSGISFSRFLRPFMISAGIIAAFGFFMSVILVPISSRGFYEFKYKWLKRKDTSRETVNLYKQISPNDFIYSSSFDLEKKRANRFTLEHFEDNELKIKLTASNITWIEEDSLYRLRRYTKRIIGPGDDIIERKREHDTIFNFDLEDLTPNNYTAETLSYTALNKFIKQETMRGSSNINRYLMVKYKKWSLPFSAFVLTVIAVAVSSIKRRGGMGVNLAFGIIIAFTFIFLDKILGVLAQKSGMEPIVAVWLPNIMFGILAIYLLNNAKR
ncbi:LptF/LptG family permease [Spongiivirga sp. MCCC 1A20706]|uniref:LptF/LptG family permease n=1 Tax=Spongiivirga sp. MCCC 1A20706 TaxID=3160963 RepID=UPI00397751D4